MIRKLTRAEVPDGAVILWVSDVHIRIQHDEALKLMIECAERLGVTLVVAGGDIFDFHCLSTHPKKAKSVVTHPTLLAEIEPGRWFLNWLGTRNTKLLIGNHETRLYRFIDEHPVLHGTMAENLPAMTQLPASIEVIEEEDELRLGNLSMFHGHMEFKRGIPAHPATKILTMLPDQSSICGHVHRKSTLCRTTRDEDGIARTRQAWTMPHMSHEEEHHDYAGKHPNWQMGFGIIRVWWDGDRPRWTVTQVEVLFDRYNKPYFEHEGVLYR